MKDLVLVCGKQGSGKTFFCKKYLNNSFTVFSASELLKLFSKECQINIDDRKALHEFGLVLASNENFLTDFNCFVLSQLQNCEYPVVEGLRIFDSVAFMKNNVETTLTMYFDVDLYTREARIINRTQEADFLFEEQGETAMKTQKIIELADVIFRGNAIDYLLNMIGLREK